ncbi:hypothetical protein F5146DRAFT_1141090 [Armillaria mellea]|nr:hypothetical protein F5146DRAFT_1141090 [Armillaria mellea]
MSHSTAASSKLRVMLSHLDDQNPYQRPVDLDDDDDGLVRSKMGSSASDLQDDGSTAEEGDASDVGPQ